MAKKPAKQKKPPNLKPAFELTKELAESKKKPRKKHDPLRKQPAWLFPPDESNPVLNPTVKSERDRKAEKDAHDASIDFLKRKSVGADMKAAPSGLLLTLVGGFLSSYGFDGASRLYTTQLDARKKLGDWNEEYGVGLPKGYPNLVRIFTDFQKKWDLDHQDETSSEDDENKSSGKDSSSEGDDGDSEDEAPATRGAKLPQASKTQGTESVDDARSSDSSSYSEGHTAKPARPAAIPSKDAELSSSSESESEVDATLAPIKSGNAIGQSTAGAANNSSSPSSSSDSGSDSSLSSGSRSTKTAKTTKQSITKPTGSDSSATLEAPSPIKPSQSSSSSSSSSSSDSDSDSDSDPLPGARIPPPSTLTATMTTTTSSKRPRSSSPVPQNTKKIKSNADRFQRIPSTTVDPKFSSNAYQPYDYADRAHQDLSVTKGRGFTKEKNKKKRGAYRGGTIDVGGGKGVRFE